ncbi:hypothetical protein G6F16_009273 [Rhizopus arrhizus]|nr:hypothetical protein G6F22_008456 [Rhizopus arrhizus]KAG0786701.1 hypothetical protein G6F21_008409 [Rhizopus arrhizus]KAG0815601.1 hypothetical protein G6F20_003867 [Rhizopus arrhizus]KAG0821420.1 hypothetical protein G6F19_011934 [Rhizopus arrhizus]KAG0822159.1 hypothetical protein G6F18_011885 [Rhizopus arrhizus]
MSSKVLIVGCIEFATNILCELQKKYSIEYCASRTRQEFIQDCSDKYKDISIIYHSPEAHESLGVFDAEMIQSFPESLKYIVYCGAGYDSIDVDACEQRQIKVSHTPMAVDDGTADIAVILILACCRNMIAARDNLRKGRFRHGLSMGTDVQGKVLGIIGAGGIGKTLAKRMAGFDLKQIQYYNRNRLHKEDIISIHCPHTAQTTHLIDYKEFTYMKKDVIIVNTARGKVINEAALVKALERGQVLAAGLDVFEEEPKVHPGLLTHPRSVLLPHIGTFTRQSQHKMEKLVLDNLVAALEHDTLLTPVPEHRKYFNK